MNQELKTIKKKYGERFMHLCRELFPTILDSEGRLLEILDANFGMPKYLYEDIMEKSAVSSFKNFIYFQYDNDYRLKETTKSPFELMDEAGYTLYECHNNDEIMQFKKYYAECEKLCTFKEHRLDDCHVFFAVKKNVDEIKREDFKNPQREDEYGTSVISIQFSRGDVNTLSIKNRYNHTVHNPDATFSNNLENIIPGLTDSFANMYHLNINQEEIVDLGLDYVKASDGKYYKYNLEIHGTHYCPDNIIIDYGEVIKDYVDKEKYILMDYFILNLQNDDSYNIVSKSVDVYDKGFDDSFIDDLQEFDKINIISNKDNTKTIELIKDGQDNVYITLDKCNNIISYINNNLKKIGSDFLYYNNSLTNIKIDNVWEIDDSFLPNNNCITEINFPECIRIGHCFLRWNINISLVKMEQLHSAGDHFLNSAWKIKKLFLPKLKIAGDYFLEYGIRSKYLCLPEMESMGNHCLGSCDFEYISMPKIKRFGNDCLTHNKILKTIKLPSLIKAGSDFLSYYESLKQIDIPNLVIVGDGFNSNNKFLNYINAPKLKEVGEKFLEGNKYLMEINFPELENISGLFLTENEIINKISLPKVKKIGRSFMYKNLNLKELYLPMVQSISFHFLYYNTSVKYLYAPNLKNIGRNFMTYNESLTNLYLPSLLTEYFQNFLTLNNNLESIYLPSCGYQTRESSDENLLRKIKVKK